MPFRTIRLSPGVNVEATPVLNLANFVRVNLVRFYTGLIQKLGGWARMSPTPLIGTCRGMEGWSDLNNNTYVGCGTEQRLEVMTGGQIFDITPIIHTDNPAVAFSTTINTSTVAITDASYTPSSGDWVNLINAVSVGGLVLQGFQQCNGLGGVNQFTVLAEPINGATKATSTVTNGGATASYTTAVSSAVVTVLLANHNFTALVSSFTIGVTTSVGGVTLTAGTYIVQSVVDSSHFTINATSTASSVATVSENGGNARIEYLLPSGFAVDTPIDGYGIGDYGSGDYGIAGTGVAIQYLREWSMQHWGQSLIASPKGGAIYFWTPPTFQPATTVSSTAPIFNYAVFVMSQVQIIVALGAETGGVQSPLLIRWCDQSDFTDWTASATNQAGSFLISSGTRLVGGINVGLNALLWTDTDVWLMTYLGFPLIFGFTQIAGSCGLISMRASGDASGVVMWLSTRGFYTYQAGGGVDSVECPVWDFLFQNVDNAQLDQIHCAVNALFNEMTWFFPIMTTSPIYSASAPLGYVKYNFVENVWDYGQSAQYQRTAWLEKNPASNPTGADQNGLLQQHEISNDADGAAMVWSWQTGYFALMEGEEFVFVDLILPDFTLQWTLNPPVITVNVFGVDDALSLATTQPLVDGPFTINSAAGGTYMIPCRLRSRLISVEFSGSDLGSFHRIGAIRVRYAPDGRDG